VSPPRAVTHPTFAKGDRQGSRAQHVLPGVQGVVRRCPLGPRSA